MLTVVVKIAIAYLLGSMLGALIVGKLYGGVDIRKLGSGNAGGTNALRTQGKLFALWVMVIDVGKGWVAAKVLPALSFGFLAAEPTTVSVGWVAVGCSIAVVLGHVYPVWFGFRGGKGAATLIGVVIGLAPIAALPVLIGWILVLALTGYVGLATMIAAAIFPIYAYAYLHSFELIAFGIAMTLFVIYTHRSNIQRMLSGTEHRAERVWLLRPR